METILIIDDDGGLRLALRAFLEGVGLRVLDAPDGPSGMAVALREAPDLTLLDLSMPGPSGFDVCRDLCALPSAPAVLVMSGLLGTSQRMRAFEVGAVDSLSKPVQYEELEARVRTHLAIRRKSAELTESRDSLGRALHDADAMNRNLVALNEKLRHSEGVKTRFLALMRNEINNPLGDIMALADRIADPGLAPEKGRELAGMLKREAFQLDCQIRNVFTAAELEAGEASPFIARVDVASVARDVLASFAPGARARGLELDADLQGLDGPFPTDGDMLHHILANLLANAVQCGGGAVRVRAGADAAHLVLDVEDQGPGISEAARKALFQPFSNAGGAFKVARGQGLGLVVVRALVDVLGGTLDIRSEPGLGTAIRVALPRAPGGPASQAQDDNILIFDEPQEF